MSRENFIEKHLDSIHDTVFFTLFFLYLWLKVDIRLIYHCGGMIYDLPVFYKGWIFFGKFLDYPGGLVEYLSAFLMQFFQYSWAGSVVVTLQAYLICICTDCFLKRVDARRLRFIRFLGPVVFVFIYGNYSYAFTTTTALMTALIFACLYLRVIPEKLHLAVGRFLLLSVILYYIAGGAYIVFAVLCIIYEVFFEKRWRKSLIYLFLAVFIPYFLGTVVFGVSLQDAFSELLPIAFRIRNFITPITILPALYLLYLILPVIAFLLGVWRLLIIERKPHSRIS